MNCTTCGEPMAGEVCEFCPTPVQMIQQLERVDMVNHPPHYTHAKYEVIDVIEAFDLPHHLACVVKYCLRWERKGGLEDLKKAAWYLNRYVAFKEGQASHTTGKTP